MVDTHVGTATTNTTPGSVAKITVPSAPQKEKSGSQWASRYPGSVSTSDLAQPFGGSVDKFIAALNAAGASVGISATYRPPERAYLMHYAWAIANDGESPTDVPAMAGVDIDWAHLNAQGVSDNAAAVSAAGDMVSRYALVHDAVLTSRHTEGRAIDMTISSVAGKSVKDAPGNAHTVTSLADLINRGLLRCSETRKRPATLVRRWTLNGGHKTYLHHCHVPSSLWLFHR
jgi:D-alanyl-D-alanine dipeptidase